MLGSTRAGVAVNLRAEGANPMSTAAVAAAAAMARTRRRLLAALRDRGAVSPATATSLQVATGPERRMLEQLVRQAIVVRTAPDRVYLDEARLAARQAEWRATRTRLIAIIAVLIGLLAEGVYLVTAKF